MAFEDVAAFATLRPGCLGQVTQEVLWRTSRIAQAARAVFLCFAKQCCDFRRYGVDRCPVRAPLPPTHRQPAHVASGCLDLSALLPSLDSDARRFRVNGPLLTMKLGKKTTFELQRWGRPAEAGNRGSGATHSAARIAHAVAQADERIAVARCGSLF